MSDDVKPEPESVPSFSEAQGRLKKTDIYSRSHHDEEHRRMVYEAHLALKSEMAIDERERFISNFDDGEANRLTRERLVFSLYGDVRRDAMAAYVMVKQLSSKHPAEWSMEDFAAIDRVFAPLLNVGDDLI